MNTKRNWVTAYGGCPNDYGRDSDLAPELAALKQSLSYDPSIAKVWLGPEGLGQHKCSHGKEQWCR